MILSALAGYCDQLRADGKLPKPGWMPRNVAFYLELSEDGSLRDIVSASSEKRGKECEVPQQQKRSVGIVPNFLCDTSSYLLGIDLKGKPERSLKCFEASREMHHKILDGVESPAAHAVLAFFDSWDPDSYEAHKLVEKAGDKPLSGGMLTFSMVDASGCASYVTRDAMVREAWEKYSSRSDPDDPIMTCLVTGECGPIARLHPSIKGVQGAQSSGATLVGFNAPAFESYGHAADKGMGQGRNAPVSERMAQAYGAALNYLLSQQGHKVRLGDATIVFWSERSDRKNSDVWSCLMGGLPSGESDPDDRDKLISEVMKAMAQGKPIAGGEVDLSSRFYVLGLAPNASRLSVRFFLQDEFGSMLKHIAEHYEQIKIAHARGREYLTPYFLLGAIERDPTKPTVSSALLSGLLRAILEGTRYPEALYENALLRIHASHGVSYGQAAIIKAFLIRNRHYSKEELTVELNEQSEDRAYALGRAFALLEQIQRTANGGSSTVASRFLNAASTTPALVFPSLLRLSNAHIAKIERDPNGVGLAVYFKRTLAELLGKGGECHSFPKRFSNDEQGSFFLGYYAQQNRPKRSDGQGAQEKQTDDNEALEA